MFMKSRARGMRALPLLICAMLAAPEARAHVNWTRINDVDPDCLALYHFDETAGGPGTLLPVAAGLPADRGLTIGPPGGLTLQTASDTPKTIFNPFALVLRSSQIADSTATLEHLSGDLTIECWFKWEASLTSQSANLGLRSGAKLTITRDTANPANDRLGISFTHGDYVSAPGFPGWEAVGGEEGSLGEWRHLALTIRSTGMHFDADSGHDVYNDGSVARIWLNGHAVGSAPHTVAIAGMRAHDASVIRLQSTGGPLRIDEFTIWSRDWSDNGTVAAPFADGRGSGRRNAATDWMRYR